MASEAEIEVKELFERWMTRTMQILPGQLDRFNIGVTEELFRSLHGEVRNLGLGFLRGEISFKARGRFIDMGAGRGSSISGRGKAFDQSTRKSGARLDSSRKGRKPKKWYSKTLYGRLNDLEGAIGFTIMEQAIQTLVQPLKS